MDLHEPGPLLSLWRNRNYILLWTGQMVSQLGTGVSQIAYPLLILALTHSPTKAGIAGAIYSLPYLLFSLPAGARNETGMVAAGLVAPSLGGVLFALARSLPFALDAMSYAASVISLMLIKQTFQQERTAARLSLGREIADGVSWLWRQKLIRFWVSTSRRSNLRDVDRQHRREPHGPGLRRCRWRTRTGDDW